MPKISALPSFEDVDGNEAVVMVKNGVTKRGRVRWLVEAAVAPALAAVELARDQVADLVSGENIFIDMALAAAEAAVSVGTYFKLVDSGTGLVDVRKRTVGGSILLYQDPTAAALDSPNGGQLVRFRQAGAGAVARKLSDKLGDAVSVKDFEAVGNGLADDTLAVQAALDASLDVFFPAGTYLITEPLRVRSFARLHGVGEASRVKTMLDIAMLVGDDPTIISTPIIENICFDNAFPVSLVEHSTITATTTAGSPIVEVDSVEGLTKAMWVTGPGIPEGTGIRYVSRSGGLDFHLCEMSYHAPERTATVSGTVELTLSYRRGQTKFHIHFHNSIRAQFYNVTIKSLFVDFDYSPENHAGIWLSRDPGSSHFAASIESCYFNKGQICCAISDSNIKNSIVWSNPFDYSISLEGPGGTVSGCNAAAGVVAAILTQATVGEGSGGSNHLIVGNNIDGGGIWYSGYGAKLDQPVNVTLTGNRINLCQKAGVYLIDGVNCVVTGNGLLKNNEDDALHSDIEVVGELFGSNRNVVAGNSHFNVARTFPGHAIREINGGAAPLLNSYNGNSVSAHYAEPAFLVLQPFATEQSGNVGSVTNGVTAFTPSWTNVGVENGTTSGWYKRHGNELTLYARLEFGSTTWVGGAIGLGSPIAAAASALGAAAAYDGSTTKQYTSVARIAGMAGVIFVYSADGDTPAFWNADNPFTWAAGDVLEIQITFPV